MNQATKASSGVALDTKMDSRGRETASSLLATPGGVDEMFISPSQAIPVIFVPGIMGSPLVAVGQKAVFENQGPWAWYPDSNSWIVSGYGGLSHIQRRDLLDPQKTRPIQHPNEVDTKLVGKNIDHALIHVDEAVRRGWGSVMISSYGGILSYLENQLRYIFYRGNVYPGTQAAVPSSASRWGHVTGYERLTDEQLKIAARWRFPVYAVGYNWMDSNSVAADFLKKRIDVIRADCRDRMKLKCDKVLLVTHSMGGLVARKFAKDNPGDVIGIVHGVQPSLGAATAYARVRTGWESSTSITRPLGSVESIVGAWALGPTGKEVAAVFANGAGPLELLPNKQYGSGWFKTFAEDGKQEIFNLPASDPYEEIYRVPDKWWRLVHPGVLVGRDDMGNPAKISSRWDEYSRKLDQAKKFHVNLGDYFHPETYSYCGNDPSYEAWGNVGWRLQPLRDASTGIWAKPLPSATTSRDSFKVTHDLMKGNCIVQDVAHAGLTMYMRNGQGTTSHYGGDSYRAWLTDKDSGGDATVPAISGLASRNHSKFFAEMRGFEHQDSYNNEHVRGVTLYSVLQVAAQASSLV